MVLFCKLFIIENDWRGVKAEKAAVSLYKEQLSVDFRIFYERLIEPRSACIEPFYGVQICKTTFGGKRSHIKY